MTPPIIRQTIGHQEFQSWSYLLACAESRVAIVIDAGGSIDDVVAMAGGFDVQSIVPDPWPQRSLGRRAGTPEVIGSAGTDP